MQHLSLVDALIILSGHKANSVKRLQLLQEKSFRLMTLESQNYYNGPLFKLKIPKFSSGLIRYPLKLYFCYQIFKGIIVTCF